MGSIQKFCDAMRWAADSDQVGYSQPDRDSLRPEDFFGSGLYNIDCSKLTVVALQYAGFETGWASYTGNMSDALCANGWERLSPWVDLKAGDILLNDSDHVAVWLGDCLAQASIDENGNIAGGARGDQSGWEVNTRDFYSYPWNCILRYTGNSDYSGGSSNHPSDGSASGGSDREWQGEVVGFEDSTGSGDDYAGVFGKPIRYLAVEGVGEYQVHDKNGNWWPCVSKYDLKDEDNGMAGAGNPIDAVRIKDPSVFYQTHNLGGDWNSPMKGLKDTGGSSDDFAGDYGVAQDAIRIWREGGEQPRYNVYS